MKVLGIICLIILAIIILIWLFRKISIARRYTKTVGEVISLKNMVPLVNKTQIAVKGKYVHSECRFKGDAYVTVRFINKAGEELTRRFQHPEPVILKINEHQRIVPQYTTAFPDWKIGQIVKMYYSKTDTTDIVVGRTPRITIPEG
jgi:hypothetical protein